MIKVNKGPDSLFKKEFYEHVNSRLNVYSRKSSCTPFVLTNSSSKGNFKRIRHVIDCEVPCPTYTLSLITLLSEVSGPVRSCLQVNVPLCCDEKLKEKKERKKRKRREGVGNGGREAEGEKEKF